MAVPIVYNNGFATTGLATYALGSQVNFLIRPLLNGLPWDLTGGSASLYLADPDGQITTLTAQILGMAAQVTWLAAGTPGTWTRAWLLGDKNNISKKTLPIGFGLLLSPR